MNKRNSSKTVQTLMGMRLALNDGRQKIIVTGDLAFKLYLSRQVSHLSKRKILMLSVLSAASIPGTSRVGGLSSAVMAPVAAATGVSVASIIAAMFLGLGLVIAIFKEYEVIEYSANRLVLKKRG